MCYCLRYKKILVLSVETKFTHWGEMIHNVDCRGEVALLTRNIVLQSEMEEECPPQNDNCLDYPYDTFGASLRVTNEPLFFNALL